MTVLERQLDRYAERIAVLRAVAVAAQPARARLLEGLPELERRKAIGALGGLVVHHPPRQHLRIDLIVVGGKPIARRRGALARRQRCAQDGRIVNHLAIGAELHRPVRIAFTRGKRIAERHDEQVLDHHLVLDEVAAVRQLDLDRDAGSGAIVRVGYACDGQLVLAGDLLAFGLAALARLPAHRQSPVTPTSCSGAMWIATVCASGRT